MVLDPASGEDIRDRGLIYLQLECFKQALEDLESYLRLAPHAEDAACDPRADYSPNAAGGADSLDRALVGLTDPKLMF